MRIIVDGLLVLLVPMTFFALAKPKVINQEYLRLGIVLVVVLHLMIGVIRWQLMPIYIAIVIVLTVLVLKGLSPRVTKLLNVVAGVLTVLTLLLTIIFPLFAMPEPTGDFVVGTLDYEYEDRNRPEIYDSEITYRRFKTQLWYPAEQDNNQPQTLWIQDGVEVKRALARDFSLPPFVFDHLANYVSNSYFEAPVIPSNSPFPIVIISHGWSSVRTLHTDLAEEMASQGYIVVGIEHTYGSLVTRFDNEFEYLNKEALPPRALTPDYLDYANRLVETYAGDIQSTLDGLEALHNDPNSPFYQRIDLGNVTAIGHSTGGGAAVKAAMDDSRITRVIGFDAWVEPIKPEDLVNGLQVPGLFIRSEAWQTGENNGYLLPLIDASSNAVLYQMDQTSHYDFAMVYMFSTLSPFLGVTGELNGRYVNEILDIMSLTFIHDSDPTQFIESPWPEIRLIETS
jgi:pimeloyl-ACP methyl ester carboxylesterase